MGIGMTRPAPVVGNGRKEHLAVRTLGVASVARHEAVAPLEGERRLVVETDLRGRLRENPGVLAVTRAAI